MTRLHAVDYDAGRAVFEVESKFIVVNINSKDVQETLPSLDALTAGAWLKVSTDFEYPTVWKELAEASATSLEVQESQVERAERKFKIPDAVRVEAQQGLDWAQSFERGFSTIGRILARKLVSDTFITTSDILRIHTYFNRLSPQTMSTGWMPGHAGYPTDDRIRFAMRGGVSARAWVNKIVDKHGLTAAGELGVGNADTHPYQEDPSNPGSCEICGGLQDDPMHAMDSGGGFEYNPDCEYFGKGVSPDSTVSTELYKLEGNGWSMYDGTGWVDIEPPAADEVIIMLDPESAQTLATFIENRDPEKQSEGLELSMIDSHEAALFALAEPEIDWEFIERVFDVYDSGERSVNAKKQRRAPGGRFGENPNVAAPSNTGDTGHPKARLPAALPLIPDVAARIQQYISENGGDAPAPTDTPAPVVSDGELNPEYLNKLIELYGNSRIDEAELAVPAAAPQPAAPAPAAQPAAPATPDPAAAAPAEARPLYLAIVDAVDTAAVLDVVSLMPGSPPTMWKRDGGAWVQAPDILAQLQGTQPPPTVELTDDAVVADVLKQVDASTAGDTTTPTPAQPANQAPAAPKPDANPDQQRRAASIIEDDAWVFFENIPTDKRKKMADKGYALPDGSFPIPDVDHLKKAVHAYGRAKNKDAAKQHIIKRAQALNRIDLIPSDWKSQNSSTYTLFGPHGELMRLNEYAGGVDRNRGNAEELRKYWTRGEGGLKIRWNTGGDWTRCRRYLSKYITRPEGYCALRHREMTGRWPGERDKNGNL